MATAAGIAQVLTSTLNPDSNIRIAAELNLSELLKNPRKPVCGFQHPLYSHLTYRERVGALTCPTRALSGCGVLAATDESWCLARA